MRRQAPPAAAGGAEPAVPLEHSGYLRGDVAGAPLARNRRRSLDQDLAPPSRPMIYGTRLVPAGASSGRQRYRDPYLVYRLT